MEWMKYKKERNKHIIKGENTKYKMFGVSTKNI